MLTLTDIIYEENFCVRIFGTETNKTKVYRFIDKVFTDRFRNKLQSVLEAINTDPMGFTHEEKFKHLEDKIMEIKIKPIRLACIWDPKPQNLVIFHGFEKKCAKWPQHELESMRTQLDKYLSSRKQIEFKGKEQENGKYITS